MKNRYDITDEYDRVNEELAAWLRKHLTPEQYSIVNEGFLIDNYVLRFNDPAAETFFLLSRT